MDNVEFSNDPLMVSKNIVTYLNLTPQDLQYLILLRQQLEEKLNVVLQQSCPNKTLPNVIAIFDVASSIHQTMFYFIVKILRERGDSEQQISAYTTFIRKNALYHFDMIEKKSLEIAKDKKEDQSNEI